MIQAEREKVAILEMLIAVNQHGCAAFHRFVESLRRAVPHFTATEPTIVIGSTIYWPPQGGGP